MFLPPLEENMKISLRRASSLQNQIQEAISNIKINTSINLTEFHDVEQELSRANVELFNNDARRQRLLLALYTVRGLVGVANANCGVDVNLAKVAFLEKRVIQLNEIVNLRSCERVDVIKGRLEKIKNVDVSKSLYSSYDNNTVTTTVVSEDQIRQTQLEVLNLKRQRQKLLDETLELNVKTEIPLNDDIVKTLTDEGLI